MRWTYSDLQRRPGALPRPCWRSGVGKGTRVGVLMGNRPEAVASLFGAALAGAVAVPLSTFSPKPELSYLLAHADISVLLLQTTMGDHHFAADVAELCPAAAGSTPVGDPRTRTCATRSCSGPAADACGIRSWESFLAARRRPSTTRSSTPSPPRCTRRISAWSSTARARPTARRASCSATGPSRCSGGRLAELFGRDESTRVWCALPLFWTAGLNAAMGATLAAGGHVGDAGEVRTRRRAAAHGA